MTPAHDPLYKTYLTQLEAKVAACNLQPTQHRLYISIGEQILLHFSGSQLIASYPVSTSKNPPSCLSGSYGTPLGLHAIAEKHGEGAPEGTVFISRLSTGQTFDTFLNNPANTGQDCITSRLLWLTGLEADFNQGTTPDGLPCDTYNRFIYLHGTRDEAAIDRKAPLSHGCIRMKNADIITLYPSLPLGTQVYIE